MGRPRIGKDDGVATTVAVRLPPKELAVVDGYAAEMGGITRSAALRDMVTHAIEHWEKMKKRRKPPR
jgi:metal-responsive CopG/Arc/MetJ family transcriptional regulator